MRQLKKAEDWIGKQVRGWYPAPAITCCQNGRECRYEGIIARIGRHPFLGRCLVLKRDTGDELYVRPEEFTHVKSLGRWIEVERNSMKMSAEEAVK